MKILKNKLRGCAKLRTEWDFPTPGIEFIDINPLIMDAKSLRIITRKFVQELKDKDIDFIVAPEARGFLFGAAIATDLKVGLLPVRKKGKLPPSTVAKTFEYEKEYGKDFLELPKLVDGEYKGKKFYIVDDIYATGNTIQGIRKAIEELGGKVVGYGAVLNIVELNNSKEVFSLIDVNES